mgnify:CR=1 FL=1
MATRSVSQLLVPAKLAPPQPGRSWVRRERLLARLDAAPGARLTLVVAPAGFGKSTLVAQWLLGAAWAVARELGGKARRVLPASPPGPVAWLTLDEHDQDSLQVLAYMAGAIARAAPGALATSLPLLGAAEPPPAYVIVQALLVDLSALPGGLTLVLDDYHLVTAEPVHRIVAYLLRHLPGTCRLVVVSRSDPPLPLARLRAEQRLVELRAGELRLTEAETGALLRLLLGATPAAEVVAALHQQTEGWAIALQLAALAHMEGHTPRRAQTTSARQIAEYLADEVFDRQPAAVRRALLALAVPERFCAELGAALLGAPGELAEAEGLLEQLVRANLFLIALDHEGRWYRFHHLFRDLLLRRLRLAEGPEALRTLRLRAAGWLAEAGLVEEAVRLYQAAGADDAAADLVERQLLIGDDDDSAPASHWLRMLPSRLSAGPAGPGEAEAGMAAPESAPPADEQAPLPPLAHPGPPELLTRREAEILGLLAERWTDKEIAARLVIAPNTVRKHTSTIYDKLGVGSRREAVDAARALGLLPPQ